MTIPIRWRIANTWHCCCLFAGLIGCPGYDGRRLGIRDAWDIAWAGWRR